eukprot:gene9400-10388_t
MCMSRFVRTAVTLAKPNPLLGEFNGLSYKVTASHVEEAIPVLVKNTGEEFAKFEQTLSGIIERKEDLTWSKVIEPVERITDRLTLSWRIVSHLHSVKDNPDLRKVHSKVLPEVVALNTRISQSRAVYEAYKILSDGTHQLNEAQQRIIESGLKAAYHSGVSLEGEKKDRFNSILKQLAELSTKFSNNVLDSNKQFGIMVNDKAQMDGLPESLLQATAKAASDQLGKKINFQEGPWKLTLDMYCFAPFMKHSKNQTLREQMYRGMIAKASTGDYDNNAVLESIRNLRNEMAKILNFTTFAFMSLDNKMAQKPCIVIDMLQSLKNKSKPVCEQEYETLQTFASKHGYSGGKLTHWDIPFWAERQVENLFKVLNGLFQLSSELFGISIKAADGEVDVWNDAVRYFKVFDKAGEHVASFYLDPYARSGEKRGGAWMDGAIDRSELLQRKPVAHLVCNQSPPSDDKPSLMTIREVETLFHEFGHGLQHMLTKVKYSAAAGTSNIEWDAVELPSQFMENWLYDWKTMQLVSGHYKTDQVLPRELFDRVVASRKHMAGSGMLRQLYFSALDMELHTSNDSWQNVMKRISDEYTIIKPLPEDKFPCSFSHIFAGGYAAGYYSYKWAELMAADAFSAFEEVGLENRQPIADVGMRFRNTILSLGGARSPKDVFIDFRGREPRPDALLKLYGLK